jgi:hypothetical protein
MGTKPPMTDQIVTTKRPNERRVLRAAINVMIAAWVLLGLAIAGVVSVGLPPACSGKWLRDDVPRSGWSCIEVTDDGGLCEMCEVTRIAYAHVMRHPHYPLPLYCGCVCAGFMTENQAQELVREVLYIWRRSQLAKRTNIEEIRRRGWTRITNVRHGRWRVNIIPGVHEFAWRDKVPYSATRARLDLKLRVESGDGWCYRLFFHNARTPQPSSNPFPTAEAAALAGIEYAELLIADPIWQATDCEAQVERWAAWDLEQAARDRENDASAARREGLEDVAVRRERGEISRAEFLTEYRRVA